MSEFDYELFAIRYATRDARRAAHFIGGDPHDGQMPMDCVDQGRDARTLVETGNNHGAVRRFDHGFSLEKIRP